MILLKDCDSIELPDNETVSKCLEHQLAKDWFSEPNKDYTALSLEANAPLPAGYKWIPMRVLFANPNLLTEKAARAHGILNWRAKSRFCSICGSPLIDDKFETARTCINCNTIFFPSISPAIIVLIHKGDQILLAKHAQRNTDMYTCLAGYLEPGETAEQCVAREIHEEVGLEVENIRYVSTQSWPFPDQFMMAFKADWKNGELSLQHVEIEDARWFTRDNLPNIPKPGSVAWNLINSRN